MRDWSILRWVAGAGLGVVLALGTADAGPAPSPAATATRAMDDAAWQSIVQRLGADDFAAREAAQKDLAAADWRQLDRLQHLADAADDPEVKSRLEKRIDDIHEQTATDPPPISLELKNATLDQAVEALHKATKLAFTAWPPGMQNNATFTLSVIDQPFWQVFSELSAQHGLTIQAYNAGQLQLMQQTPGWQALVRAGPLAIVPESITESKTVMLQQPAGQQIQPRQMSLSYQVVVDPRVVITRYAQPVLTEITDDVGNVLAKSPPPDPPAHAAFKRFVWSCSAMLTIPERRGTRIVSAKGAARFLVQVARETIVVTDIDKKLNQPLTIAGQTVVILRFDAKADSINLTASLQHALPGGGILFNNNNDLRQAGVTLTLIDAADKRVWSTVVSGTMGAGIGGQFTPPLRLELSVPTRTKEVTIPFELKDLPLP